MKKLISIPSLIVVGLVTVAAANPSLPTGVYTLTSLDLDAPASDLMPFLSMTRKAKIVGLGESVHTDGSFHKLNARLTKALIEQQGFRIVLVETPRALAQGLQDYVKTCDSNPSLLNALQTILPQFNSLELATFYTWVRDFNCKHPSDQVTLMGMDIQDPGRDELRFEKFVTASAPTLVGHLSDLKICVPDAQDVWSYQGPTTDADLKKCLDFLTDLEPYINTEAPETRFELELSSTALHYNAGYTRYESSDDVTAESWRDKGMATMIRAITGHFPGKKTAIIAHAEHVGRGTEQLGQWVKKAMGTFLSEWYGTDYFVSAAFSYRPETAAWWPGTYTPGQTTFEAKLHDLNQGDLLINLDHNALVPAGAGVALGAFGGLNVVMSQHWDFFAYVDIGQPMTDYPGIQYQPSALILGPTEQDFVFGPCSPGWSLTNQGLSVSGQGFSATCDPKAEIGAGGVLLQANPVHNSGGGVFICESVHDYFGNATLTGRLRTEMVANGSAGLFVIVNDSNGNTLVSANMPQPLFGTIDWTNYQIHFNIPTNADGGTVCFGVSFSGDGAVGVEKMSVIPGQERPAL